MMTINAQTGEMLDRFDKSYKGRGDARYKGFLFRGMMLKSKESHIKIAGHSKCLAISFIRKRNVRCFAWNGKKITVKKEELYPIKPKTLHFRYLNCRFR